MRSNHEIGGNAVTGGERCRGRPGARADFWQRAARRWCIRVCAAVVAALAICSPGYPQTPSVEVMHWLVSGHDRAALSVVRDGVIARGGLWVDSPMPGAGESGMAAAVSRIVGGKPPSVFQFSVGSSLSELAEQHLLAPVSLPASWDALFPVAIARFAKYKGAYIAVPMDIRGENWLFYNHAVLQSHHLDVPRTWPQLVSEAATLKKAGIIPIALGGQSWQERMLFDAVLLGVGGRDFYRQVYEHRDLSAVRSKTMLQAFATFASLRPFVDEGSPGRRWSQTTALLIQGRAAFQVMGDWAKQEIIAAGLTPGEQIGCVLTPAPLAAYVMTIDAFAFPRTTDLQVQAGQQLFASTVRDKTVQRTLAQRLGALPARNDISAEGFDRCSAEAMAVIRDPQAQLMDPGMSLPSGLAGAIDDAVSTFWNNDKLLPAQGQTTLQDVLLEYQEAQ
jgi:glucose/mannose transport system substrate-binding protein